MNDNSSTREKPPSQHEQPQLPLCMFCKEELEFGVAKCVKCGEWQNWRRYIFFGNTTLTLLIALISVLSLSYERLRDLVSSSSAINVSAETILVSQTEVRLWAANVGGGIAVPTKVRFLFLPKGEEFIWGAHELPHLDVYSSETAQLFAGSAGVLSFVTPANEAIVRMEPRRARVFSSVFGKSSTCEGELHYLAGSGEKRTTDFKVTCRELMDFILAHQGKTH